MSISNPFADPLFAPTLVLVLGVLGGGLSLVLLLVHGDLTRLRSSVLFARWATWAVIAPLYTGAILGGALPLLGLLSVLVAIGLHEYSRLVALPAAYRRPLLGVGLLAAPAALLSPGALGALPPVLFLGATLPHLLRGRPGGLRHLAFAALGWGYIAGLLAHAMLIHRYIPGGPGILIALGVATALSDIGAFVVGSRWGRRPLAPALSPHKTWEGVGGNLLGAYLGTALAAFALPAPERPLLLAVLPLIVAGGALWGDLLESSIKREFGAKDAGTWLPGFGGLLDRLDSLIIVVPLVFYFLWLLS